MTTQSLLPPDLADASDEILDRLSLIGQDITASLNFGDIFAAVERHVGVLLDAATFYIGTLDGASEWIDVPFFVDGGERSTGRRIRLDDPVRPASRSIRERCEILREKTLDEAIRTDIPGTVPTLSALFRPLVVRERTIGVMSVQSRRAGAYGTRERLIFRTLCAYVAVALANGESFRRLAAAEAEKMASLAKLVAGIAHEVNTPVGTALTVATTFGQSARDFRGRLQDGALRRSELSAFVEQGVEVARQVTTNLMRTNDLISQFRNVALDRSEGRKRAFLLAELVSAVLTSLGLDAGDRAHRIEVAVDPDLELVSFPEALSQVLANLVANALIHAFPDGEAGTVRVSATRPHRAETLIVVSDDGVGISEADRASIFEPFSTSRRGGRGTGLGLHIAYNLAVNVLEGGLSCRSIRGHGSSFRVSIPSRAAGGTLSPA